ncbi:MAG: DUF481 domain-containing protein [Bacteroidota bacterium]|nr:DUF481 domain-containing protein [Bacteroidota bacterium]
MKRNRIYVIIVLFILGIQYTAKTQIVNIERKRISADSTGFLGSAYLNFAGAKTTKSVLSLGTGILLEYKSKSTNDLWLFISDFSLISGEKEKFSNNGFGHLRFNKKIGKAIRWEVFTQLQYNSLTKIDKRALLGSGLRFKMTQYEKARFYLGIGVMYEYEELLEPRIIHHDQRSTNYLSFTLMPEETVSFASTTYVQPLLKDLRDYRIYTENTLDLDITKKLTFIATIKYGYDTRPPEGVPTSTYAFSNGIKITF